MSFWWNNPVWRPLRPKKWLSNNIFVCMPSWRKTTWPIVTNVIPHEWWIQLVKLRGIDARKWIGETCKKHTLFLAKTLVFWFKTIVMMLSKFMFFFLLKNCCLITMAFRQLKNNDYTTLSVYKNVMWMLFRYVFRVKIFTSQLVFIFWQQIS